MSPPRFVGASLHAADDSEFLQQHNTTFGVRDAARHTRPSSLSCISGLTWLERTCYDAGEFQHEWRRDERRHFSRSVAPPRSAPSFAVARVHGFAYVWRLATPVVWALTPRGQQDQFAPLTDISAIRAMTPEIANERRRVLVRGTVTYINEREPAGIIVHDGSAGLFVRYGRRYFLPATRPAPRRRRRSRGLDVRGRIRPRCRSRNGAPGRPIGASASETRAICVAVSGVFDCEYIEVVGVGQRAWLSESGKTLFVDVAVEGGAVRAWFWDFSAQDLTRFIDARVRLRGNAGTLFNQRGRCAGSRSSQDAPPTPSSTRRRPIRGRCRFARSRVCTPITRRIRSTGVCGCTGP